MSMISMGGVSVRIFFVNEFMIISSYENYPMLFSLLNL